MFYRNHSTVAKTFYGVTFQPGEIKEVPGYINNKSFDIVDAPKPKEPPKSVEQPTKSDLPKEPKPDGRRKRKTQEPKDSIVISTNEPVSEKTSEMISESVEDKTDSIKEEQE